VSQPGQQRGTHRRTRVLWHVGKARVAGPKSGLATGVGMAGATQPSTRAKPQGHCPGSRAGWRGTVTSPRLEEQGRASPAPPGARASLRGSPGVQAGRGRLAGLGTADTVAGPRCQRSPGTSASRRPRSGRYLRRELPTPAPL